MPSKSFKKIEQFATFLLDSQVIPRDVSPEINNEMDKLNHLFSQIQLGAYLELLQHNKHNTNPIYIKTVKLFRDFIQAATKNIQGTFAARSDTPANRALTRLAKTLIEQFMERGHHEREERQRQSLRSEVHQFIDTLKPLDTATSTAEDIQKLKSLIYAQVEDLSLLTRIIKEIAAF